MASEITLAEDDEKTGYIVDKETEKQKIRQIIDYQKSLYCSSSSSLSSSSSSSSYSASRSRSSFPSPQKRRNLLGLMKEGSTSLGRLFNMEHTSLGNYFQDYCGSPMIKPILLWGSDSDAGIHDDPWTQVNQIKSSFGSRIDDQKTASLDCDKEIHIQNRLPRVRRRKLTRTKSYKRLPRFHVLWRFGQLRFKFRLRFRRILRVMICGRML